MTADGRSDSSEAACPHALRHLALIVGRHSFGGFARCHWAAGRFPFCPPKEIIMKSLVAPVFALALLASGTAFAQVDAGGQAGPVGAGGHADNGDVGAGAHVGGVGAGAHVGNGVGVGVHVGDVGLGVNLGSHHRYCHGGWYWHNHHHYCRRW
jgi:hypothetical protein